MKTSLKYGIIGAGALALLDYLFYNYLYKSLGAQVSFVQMGIIGLTVFFCIRELKVKKYGGEISYKDASIGGFVMVIITSLLYAAIVFFGFPYGNENFANESLVMLKEYLFEQGKNPLEIQAEIKKYQIGFQPKFMAMSALFGTLIIGIIFSLIFASWHRKRMKPDSL